MGRFITIHIIVYEIMSEGGTDKMAVTPNFSCKDIDKQEEIYRTRGTVDPSVFLHSELSSIGTTSIILNSHQVNKK